MIWNPFIIVSVDSTDVLNNCFGRGSRDLIMLKIGSIQRSGFLFLEKSKLISINKNIVSYANRRLDNKPHMQAKSLFNPYAIKLMSFSDFPWMLVTLSFEFIIPALTRLGLGSDRSASSILSRGGRSYGDSNSRKPECFRDHWLTPPSPGRGVEDPGHRSSSGGL